MGTRGLNGWVVDGNVYASYNQYDTYPDGLGRVSIEYVKELLRDDTVEQTKEQVRALVKVKEDDEPTAEQLAPLVANGRVDGNVSTGQDWYSALRNNQGTYREILETGIILDSAAFAADSLFCEYAYLVNLDDSTLEFYQGFQKAGATIEGRFAELESGSEGYAPITLVKAFPFELVAKGDGLSLVRNMQRAIGYDEADLATE